MFAKTRLTKVQCVRTIQGLLIAALVLPVCLIAAAAEPQKLAFVVGISKYKAEGLNDLAYAELDARALAAELQKLNFTVIGVAGENATRSALETRLLRFFDDTKKLSKQDLVLISFSGHGLQLSVTDPKRGLIETPFYCPYDARKTDPATLLSLNWVMQHIADDSSSNQNLLLVDACRDNPAKGAKGVDGSTVKELPSKLSVLFGSSAGTQSYEAQQIKHGIFTQCLLDGLRGEAADKRGNITWLNLASYTMDHVKERAQELVGQPQQPNLLGNLVSQPMLAKGVVPANTVNVKPSVPEVKPALPKNSQPPVVVRNSPSVAGNSSSSAYGKPTRTEFKPTLPGSQTSSVGEGKSAGDLRADNTLGMKLVWCPKGQFKMGTAPNDLDRIDETQVDVTLTQGFWMGQTSVTQSQWNAVMPADSRNPWLDQFDTNVKEGDDYPATYVSAEDADEFVKKLNAREQAAGRLPSGWSYALPTEAQREYATRAGTTTRYWFGDDHSRISLYAWWGALSGFGNCATENYAHRVAQTQPNPWKLYDVHGNVFEWCQDHFADRLLGGKDPVVHSGSNRVLRGGCWGDDAMFCRSAVRHYNSPDFRGSGVGFRVTLVPSSEGK